MRSRLSITTALLLGLAALGRAQQAPAPVRGDQVRVTVRGEKQEGALVELTPERIVFDPVGADSGSWLDNRVASRQEIPSSEIDRLEVRRPGSKGDAAATGLLWGWIAGAGFGAIAYGSGCTYGCSAGEGILVASLYGAMGGGIGAVIGMAIGVSQWEAVPVANNLAVSPRTDGGVAISTTIGW